MGVSAVGTTGIYLLKHSIVSKATGAVTTNPNKNLVLHWVYAFGVVEVGGKVSAGVPLSSVDEDLKANRVITALESIDIRMLGEDIFNAGRGRTEHYFSPKDIEDSYILYYSPEVSAITNIGISGIPGLPESTGDEMSLTSAWMYFKNKDKRLIIDTSGPTLSVPGSIGAEISISSGTAWWKRLSALDINFPHLQLEGFRLIEEEIIEFRTSEFFLDQDDKSKIVGLLEKIESQVDDDGFLSSFVFKVAGRHSQLAYRASSPEQSDHLNDVLATNRAVGVLEYIGIFLEEHPNYSLAHNSSFIPPVIDPEPPPAGNSQEFRSAIIRVFRKINPTP